MAEEVRFRFVIDLVMTVAVVCASVVVTWTALSIRSNSRRTQPESASVAQAAVAMDAITMVTRTASRNGQPRLAIVEFSDFECPFCGQYARETWQDVNRELIQSGQITYVFRHFPLTTIHARALAASEAAECAGEQGHFWEMHRQLFSHQDALNRTDLIRYAAEVGLNLSRFHSCLADDAVKRRIREDQSEGRRLGVTSTPTLLFGEIQSNGSIKLSRKLTSAQPFDLLKRSLESVNARESLE
jgi:protein-disulfide isomerase